ncbi:phosphomethylpyrimidine synthase ThiC [Kiritimatiella glycovorans]|uniref:Phosphomethylpyrimidine synthase n=1 Tax=Kiritimatiella glycovorans TaxID=1307763 RepID=A0A0G3EIS2_9BACT|nr:phosphomethylpyrimidine synthase ThiC [Kiritimatiella glycovorans]AKJ64069.1 Phosphomethylpyrimidine synthase [Kiritimatiella glycovorans]
MSATPGVGDYGPYFPGSRKIYREGARRDLRVPFRRIELGHMRGQDGTIRRHPPVEVYDTSGPHCDPAVEVDPREGLPELRADWIREREAGGAVTQREWALRGVITPEMEFAAIRENEAGEGAAEGREVQHPGEDFGAGIPARVSAEFVRREIAAGRAVLPASRRHPESEPMVIGRAFRTKINANLGNSAGRSSLEEEVEKMRWSTLWGADTVMDLSTGEAIPDTREAILRNSPVPVGTVPIYEALRRAGDDPAGLDWPLFRDVLREQAEQGVDYMTLHAGVRRDTLPSALRRRTGIVSRGGSILARWIQLRGKENFIYEHFDEVCALMREYDVAFSLGDGLRPGCLADANDEAQFAELRTLGELTRTAWNRGCQVMIEGPGHVPLHRIAENMERELEDCFEAPFYTLGPLVTDIGAGYDHVNSAIGGSVMAWHGAAMLCYVTPKEHLGLPDRDDVREGVVVHRMAAHAADLARGIPGAQVRDNAISAARYDFRWRDVINLCLDPERARRFRYGGDSAAEEEEVDVRYCSMCGEQFCSMRMSRRVAEEDS